MAAAFVVGVLSANPVVDAAKSGWQPVVADLQSQIDEISVEPEVITRTASDDFNKFSRNKTLEVTCEEDEVFLTNSNVVTYDPIPTGGAPVNNVASGPIESEERAGDTELFSHVIGWDHRTADEPENGFDIEPTEVTISIACVKP